MTLTWYQKQQNLYKSSVLPSKIQKLNSKMSEPSKVNANVEHYTGVTKEQGK